MGDTYRPILYLINNLETLDLDHNFVCYIDNNIQDVLLLLKPRSKGAGNKSEHKEDGHSPWGHKSLMRTTPNSWKS